MAKSKKSAVVRTFATGATRDTDTSKPDYEGFISPLVLEAFGAYMGFNRKLIDGSTRDSDNWQKGMPMPVYMKSGWRHFVDWWKFHRGMPIKEGVVFAICGLLFNAQGFLHEYLKAHPGAVEAAVAANEKLRAERWAAIQKAQRKARRERASEEL